MAKKSDLTKLFILEKAAPIFNQKGFNGTALSDIESETQLTKGCIYGHFRDKSELALETFKFSVKKMNELIAQRTSHVENTVDKLKAVVYFYREHINSYPIDGGCPLLNAAIESDDHVDVLKSVVEETLNHWHSRIVRTLEKGIERREIKANCTSEKFAWLFIGVLEGANFISRVSKDDLAYKAVTDNLLMQIESLRLK